MEREAWGEGAAGPGPPGPIFTLREAQKPTQCIPVGGKQCRSLRGLPAGKTATCESVQAKQPHCGVKLRLV
jgi:hypothetical protein